MIGQVENERFKNIFQSGDGFLQSNNTAWTLVIVLAVAFGFTLLVILRMRRSRWRTEGVTSADEDIFRLMCNANSLTPHQIYELRD
ncbi:MAG: hypothetical protein L3J82_01790, partial [Planctomycetes bacterium]|nr:hypothetical protein [Planctomycetota bacterium]